MKKNLKTIIPIIISLIILILDILLFFKLKGNWNSLTSSQDSYNSAGLLIAIIYQFGSLFYGLVLILIVWLEYLLYFLLKKISVKLDGIKKYIIIFLIPDFFSWNKTEKS